MSELNLNGSFLVINFEGILRVANCEWNGSKISTPAPISDIYPKYDANMNVIVGMKYINDMTSAHMSGDIWMH